MLDKNEIEKFNNFRKNCLINADDLITTAEGLLGKNVNHIAFHLATLAMEEVGKLSLMWFQMMSDADPRWEQKELNLSLDDHIKKLFWAIWGPDFGKNQMTNESIEQQQQLARSIHDKRLFSLYTDYGDSTPSNQKVSDQQTEDLIKLVRARVEMEKAQGESKSEMDQEDLNELKWFFDATDVPEKRKLIFGAKSQEKLISLGSVKEWVRWLKDIFDENDAQIKNLLKQELERKKPNESELQNPKWKMRIKAQSPSHTIKNKDLKFFNEKSDFIKLSAGGDVHTLLMELTLTKAVPIQLLWDRGWMLTRMYLAALSIGTQGIFWWNVPKDISKYYVDLRDLEKDLDVVLEMNPRIEIDWKSRQAKLDQTGLNFTSLVFAYMTRVMNTKEFEPFNEYINGLGLVAKNDIHLRFEVNALLQFYNALRIAMILGGDYDPSNETIVEAAKKQLSEALSQTDELEKNLELAIKLSKNPKNPPSGITLTQVIAIKNYADLYFIKLAAKKLHNGAEVKLVVEQPKPKAKDESEN